MATTIVTKNGSGAPTDSDLVAGELAVDLTNGRLYTDDGSSVIEIGLNPSGNVDVTGTVTLDDTLNISGGSTTAFVQASGTLFQVGSSTASDLVAYTNNAERLRIDSSGNVGIGTDSPSSYFSPELVVHSSSNLGGITIRSNATTDTNYLLFADGISGNERYRGYVGYDHNTDTMNLATGASPAISIDSSGNVGIGTDSPADLLHVKDTSSVVGGHQIIAEGGTGGYGAGISFQSPLTGGSLAEMARITADGEASWNTTATTQDAGLRFYTSLDGTVAERLRILANGNTTFKANNSGQGPILTLENTDTSITTNDVLGQIDFYANDGSTGGTGQKATIQALAENSSGTSVGLSFGTSPFPNTTASERMRIDANGNVGIGTASPTFASGYSGLHINKDYPEIHLTNTNSGATASDGFKIQQNSASNIFLWNYENAFLAIGTNNTERLRIDADGNVGIGCTPEDWDPAFDVLRVGRTATLFSYDTAGDGLWLGSNAFYDDTLNDYKYITTDPATLYTQINGTHTWSYAASGTADTQVTFSEAMRNDTSGNFLVGTTDTAAFDGTSGILIGGANSALAFSTTGNNQMLIYSTTDGLQFYDATNNAQRMLLDNSGNVGIGVSPAKTLDVRTSSGSDAVIRVGSSSSIGINVNVGAIEFYSADADDAGVKASIANYVTGNEGPGGAVDGNLIFSTTDSDGGGNDSPTERMRIDSNGNVGIGTSSPVNNLQLSASAYASVPAAGATGHMFAFGSSAYGIAGGSLLNGNSYLQSTRWDATATNYDLLLQPNGGNLLVGQSTSTSPGAGNTTTGFSLKADGQFFASSPSGDDHVFNINGTGNIISIRTSGTQVGSISVTGSATAYNTSSDYRLKENVVAMSGATERLKQLKPSRFNFIADPDTTVDGFLAHEVQDIVPEAITGTKDAVDAEGNPEYQGIDQSKLVPLLVATIQELEARIAALEGAN